MEPLAIWPQRPWQWAHSLAQQNLVLGPSVSARAQVASVHQKAVWARFEALDKV